MDSLVREKLITEEWCFVYDWMKQNPERYGDIEFFPDIKVFMDGFVPSFTDSCGLFLDGEFVAIALLDGESNVHCIVNPDYYNKYRQAKAIRQLLLPKFTKRYKYLYTEFVAGDKKVEKFIRFLGFTVLPESTNIQGRQMALLLRG